MLRDYNRPNLSLNRRAKRRSPLVWLVATLVLCIGAIALVSLPTPSDSSTRATSPDLPPASEAPTLRAPETTEVSPLPPEPQTRLHKGEIQPGDTFAQLVGDYLNAGEIHEISRQCRSVFRLNNLKAGRPFTIQTREDDFDCFVYEIDREEQLIIRRDEESFAISRESIPYETTVEQVGGVINSSLFEAVSSIGEEIELAVALSDIFGWDIDFIRDIREGDSFRALVEKRFRDGKSVGYGRILAAEFSNQGESYQAVLYAPNGGDGAYYRPDGSSMRRAFLKAPLSFTRISSGYTLKRFHPIQKTWKAHPAIDYAAPTGTPIKTVGDGRIVQIGYTKGNGNYIRISHNNGYETMYLHMKGFAKGMHRGKKVSQGQVIGYVGSTGLATGPHLCFRMKRNGHPVNPYKVKTPAGTPVPKSQLAEFRSMAAPLLARLQGEADDTRQVASATAPPSGSHAQ